MVRFCLLLVSPCITTDISFLCTPLDSPSSYGVVLSDRKALKSFQHAGLSAFLHFLNSPLPLKEEPDDGVGCVDFRAVVIAGRRERLQLGRKRFCFCSG